MRPRKRGKVPDGGGRSQRAVHPQSSFPFFPATLRQAVAPVPPRTFRSPITVWIKIYPLRGPAVRLVCTAVHPYSHSSILYARLATRGTQPAIHVYTVLSIFAPLSCMNPPIAPLAPLSSHIHDVVFEQRVRRYNASVFAHWEARLIASQVGSVHVAHSPND